MNKQPFVYVVLEPERLNHDGTSSKVYDISTASEFGEVLTPAMLPRGIFGATADWITDQLRRELGDFTKDDYLLLIGDPVAIGIACAVASDITGGNVNVLRWNPKEQRYASITFNVHKRNNRSRKDGGRGASGTNVDDGAGLDGRAESVRRAFKKRYKQ